MSKLQVGDLVKVKKETAEDWDNMIELYNVDPDSLGVVVDIAKDSYSRYYCNVLFRNRTLHFEPNELELV